MLNKHLIILIFVFSVLLCYFCYGQGYRENLNSIQIHIEVGPSQAIRFFREGMICKTSIKNSKGLFKSYTTFFPINSLDYDKINKLKNFIYYNSFFSKDTICDQPGFGTTSLPIYITIIKDENLNVITWQDGNCKELEKLIDMINDLIPKERRDMFKIYYKHLIPENK